MTNMRLRASSALAVTALILLAAWAGRATAAAPKPSLDVTFGPIQVEGDSRATFFLVLRNSGGADSKLVLGDEIEIVYGTGGGTGDLLAANQQMAVDLLPAGVALQRIFDADNHETGVRLAVEGDVTIPAGESQAFLLEGATAPPGAARVGVATRLSKAAGKATKSLAVAVVKTPPVSAVDFYGDGSDGILDVAADTQLQPLRNHTDVLIRAGVTVTVPSGTTIRCRGSFENRGTIVVLPGSPGGGTPFATLSLGAQLEAAAATVERGDSFAAPHVPAALNLQPVGGAKGGVGIGNAAYALPLSHYRHGGGGGSGTLGCLGGDGGGLLRVIARGRVSNGGTIRAKGGSPTFNRTGLVGGEGGGGGGGGGGIVILASGTSVDNSAPANVNGPAAPGTVDVGGGAGGTADPNGGGGGGGGGGLVVFCAPTVPSNGTTNLFGGLSAFQPARSRQ